MVNAFFATKWFRFSRQLGWDCIAMAPSLPWLGRSLPFSRFFRQFEQDMETVVKVLQPGPLGIIEHKFTAEEINKAKSIVNLAVENWRRNAYVERNSPFLRDFIAHDRM